MALPIALLVALLAAACGPDAAQVDLCERVLRVVMPGGDQAVVIGHRDMDAPEKGIELTYRPEKSSGATHKFRCLYAATGFGPDRLQISGIVRPDGTHLGTLSLRYLRMKLNLR